MHRSLVKPLALLFAIACLLPAAVQAQEGGRRTMQFDASEAVLMIDAGAVVLLSDGEKTLTVKLLPLPGGSSAGLEEGDEVGMANGKRVRTIAELREIYEGTKPGEEFKLGIRRDGRTQIVTIERKDQMDGAGGARMMVRRGPTGENEDVFPALGFGIASTDGATTVNLKLPHGPEEVTVKEGDEVVSINGKKVTTSADFSRELDATKIGDPLVMTFRRDGKEYTVKLNRPEPQGGMIRMRREQ